MVTRALDKLKDGLEQALQEAQATQMDQLEQFMKNQMQEHTRAVEKYVEKGTERVIEAVGKLQPQLDMIQREIKKQNQSS